MARRPNITALAEGVETREDWNLLRELGRGLAQGYLDWVRDWKVPG